MQDADQEYSSQWSLGILSLQGCGPTSIGRIEYTVRIICSKMRASIILDLSLFQIELLLQVHAEI